MRRPCKPHAEAMHSLCIATHSPRAGHAQAMRRPCAGHAQPMRSPCMAFAQPTHSPCRGHA
eukprot:11217715-Lingulodinium_polyedra.AAC.1